MNKIPTYNFHDIGREEKLVDLFIWTEPDPYQTDSPHCHEYHEIMIFYKGGGSHEIDFKKYDITEFSFHIIPKNFIHQLNRKPSSKGFTIALSDVFVEQLCRFDQSTNYHSLFEQENIIKLSKPDFLAFEFYLNEIRKPNTDAATMQNICAAIMLKLYPFFADHKIGFSSFTSEVRKAIENNCMKRLSTSQYAEMFKVSAIHLNAKLKKATGKTMRQLQDDMLISKIKRQLYSTDMSLKEIAYLYGYHDYAHFSKFFKMHTGYSPTNYRLLLKNIQEVDKN